VQAQELERFAAPGDGSPLLDPCEQVLGEQTDVVAPLAQRRDGELCVSQHAIQRGQQPAALELVDELASVQRDRPHIERTAPSVVGAEAAGRQRLEQATL
jgi:hypothetical protein